ncbi:MAG TPA: methyltransferase domain-containing protein, partial [Verrucomicrobiae bacterium]
PFLHKETDALDLVFQHYAYATEAQLQFKEQYYGYPNAVAEWKKLQAAKLPARLSDHLTWVKDGAMVNTTTSQGIIPLIPEKFFTPAATLAAKPEHQATPSVKKILFVRPDAIGDAVLAASMLEPLRLKYTGAQIAVLCQEHLAQFWAASPCVDLIIGINKQQALADKGYRDAIKTELQKWAPDLVLNSVFSSEALFEDLIHTCPDGQKIGLNGDLSNISVDERLEFDLRYSRQISSQAQKSELEHHGDFLTGLEITPGQLQPKIWTTPDDDAVAEEFFTAKKLDPARTIALFPGSQHSFKAYPHFAAALKNLAGYQALIFGGDEICEAAAKLAQELPFPTHNHTGKTTIREMASLIRKCRLLVGSDSAGAHIACAVGVPNVVVLGGGHFGRFFPYSALTSVACLPLECYGCNWRCKHAAHHCLADISPAVVAEAVRQTLAVSSAKPRLFFQSSSPRVPWKSARTWIHVEADWIAVESTQGKPQTSTRAKELLKSKTKIPTPSSPTDPNLSDVEKNWNEFGKRDPLWAILTDEKRKNGRWDVNEFFALGQGEIKGVISYLDSLKFPYRRGKALDFGCGVGRLTQALAQYFEECHGVDIASSMIDQARSYNKFGARCQYHLNKATDLKLFANNSFDFIYSNIVLQHNQPENSRKFIREFLRLLAPGGILLFQIPSHPIGFQQAPGDRLPLNAYKADIRVQQQTCQAVAGTALDLRVSVRNVSPVAWPLFSAATSNAVKLGNHWLDTFGRTIVHDDARTSIPAAVLPGQSVDLALSVTVPGKPGKYILELDLVQEHVCWFAQHGSKSTRLEIEVLPNTKIAAPAASGSSSPQAGEVLVPRMEMHGIHKAELLEFLKAEGATIIDVKDDSNATGWIGYRYC